MSIVVPIVPPHELEYLAVLKELTAIRNAKVASYGPKRYEPMDEELQRWLCYSDVYRKFIRLERQMRLWDVEGLLETYKDLANYAIMAVQLLGRKNEEQEHDV